MSIHDLPRPSISPLDRGDLNAASAFLYANHLDFYRSFLPLNLLQQHTEASFRRHLERHLGNTWLAKMGEEIVGLVSVTANCIDDLWVKPGYARRGIGRRLVDLALSRIEMKGHIAAQAGVEDFNAPARSFFEGRGWRMIGSEYITLEPGTSVEAFVFSKAIETRGQA